MAWSVSRCKSVFLFFLGLWVFGMADGQRRTVFTDSRWSLIWAVRRIAHETGLDLWSIGEFEVK